jgi:hypothetical protein
MQALPIPLRDLLQRIEAKTEKTKSCWLWQGAMSGTIPILYISYEDKEYRYSVRRLIWLSCYGPILGGELISTSCRVDRCIRDHHLRSFRGVPRRGASGHTFPPKWPDVAVKHTVQLYHQGLTTQQVQEETGIPRGTIEHYIRGEMRQSVTGMGKIPGGYWRKQRHIKGQVHPRAIVSWQQVLVTLALRQYGYTERRIADFTQTPKSEINLVLQGRAWDWLTHKMLPIVPRRNASVRSADPYRKYGQSNPRNILTWQEVLVILGLLNVGYPPKVVAKNFRVSPHVIQTIHAGVNWDWLTHGIPRKPLTLKGEANGSAKLSQHQVLAIVDRARNHREPYKTIAETSGVSLGTVNAILGGKVWSWLTSIQPNAKQPATPEPHPDEAQVRQDWQWSGSH